MSEYNAASCADQWRQHAERIRSGANEPYLRGDRQKAADFVKAAADYVQTLGADDIDMFSISLEACLRGPGETERQLGQILGFVKPEFEEDEPVND